MDPFREVRTPEKNYGPANIGGRQVTPLARRLAAERRIDLANIKGSGPHGRIVAGDIESATPQRPAASGLTAPHLYLVADIDIGRALALCAEANAGTPTEQQKKPAAEFVLNDLIVKAWAVALKRIPAANMAWAEGRIVRCTSSDISVVIAKGDRTTTLIVRNAEAKSLTAISAEMRDLAARAGDNKLESTQYQGSASAISNLGMYGVREFAAIINPPHTTLLAVGASRRAPVEAQDGSVKFVSQITVTLSCDHGVIDGALGAQLIAAFKALMEDPVTALI
jgi:pyruvate dehydrogenase E2 component (dihydrolipoamide acetyltransferase)